MFAIRQLLVTAAHSQTCLILTLSYMFARTHSARPLHSAALSTLLGTKCYAQCSFTTLA